MSSRAFTRFARLPALPAKHRIRHFQTSSILSTKYFTLNTGDNLPAIGLGTFQDPDQQEDAVATALKLGYRHIDTARVYDTEKQVGQGIRRSNVPRDQIFVTTKLWSNDHHPEDVATALNASLEDLKLDYVDLFLMHYPCTFQRGSDRFPRVNTSGDMIMGETTYIDTWKAMEMLLKTKKVRAIGVSNFSKGEMEKLLASGNVTPAVHQYEGHPYLQQKDFLAWHKEQGIQVMSFSPLGNQNDFYAHAQNIPKVIEDPILKLIGSKHNKSPVQVCLAWSIAKGRAVISKSTIPWQLEQNLESDSLELDDIDIECIDALDKKLRFNYAGLNYGHQLYSDLEGV